MARTTKWNPAHHPRDARGRFTKSATRVLKAVDAKRARAAVQGFKPVDLGAGAGAGREWLDKQTPAKATAGDAVARYFAGEWKTINGDLRTKKDAAQTPDVVAIDKAMTGLTDDVMLERRIPLRMFAHIPMDQLKGMKVRDAAYASTMLQGAAGDAPDGMVTLHIAAPAGTRAIVNPGDGEVLLDRDTEVAISRVEPDGRGGYDLYGVAISKAGAVRAGRPAGDPADQEGAEDPDATADPAPAPAPAADADDTDPAIAGTPPRKAAPKKAAPAARPADEPAQDGPDPAAGTRAPSAPRKAAQDGQDARQAGEDDDLIGAAAAAAALEDAGEPVPIEAAVADLQPGAYARVTGTDQYGAPASATGYVGAATPVTVRKNRRSKAKGTDKLAVYMTETPNGANGWRYQILTDPDATAEIVPDPASVPPTPADRTPPATVADLQRGDYVSVRDVDGVERTGWITTPGDVRDGKVAFAVTAYPGGKGFRAMVYARPDDPVTPRTVDPNMNVVLWRDVKTKRPAPRADQPEIVRGQVERDPQAEAEVRTALAALAADQGPPTPLDADEQRAAVAGRTFARTEGMTVADDETRFRMRKARVGARIVDVHNAQGVKIGTATQGRDGWSLVDGDGNAQGDAPAFANAVAVLDDVAASPDTPDDRGGEVSPLGEDLDAPPPAADPFSAAATSPSRNDWFGHGSPDEVLWFGNGSAPGPAGTRATVRRNGGRGKNAGLVVRSTGPDGEILARIAMDDQVWLADVPGASPAPGRRADGTFEPDGTPADQGAQDGPTPAPKQLDAMMTALVFGDARLAPGRQMRAQMLRMGWADATGKLTPDGHAAARRTDPARYRDRTAGGDDRGLLDTPVRPAAPTAGTRPPAAGAAVAGDDQDGMTVVRTKSGWAVSGRQPYYLHDAKSKKAAQQWIDDAMATRRKLADAKQASAAAEQAHLDRHGLDRVDAGDLKPADVYVYRLGGHTRTVTQVDTLDSGAVMVHDQPGPDAQDDPLPHLLFTRSGGPTGTALRFRDPARADAYRTHMAAEEAEARAELARLDAADEAARVTRIAEVQALQAAHTPAAVAAAAAHDPAEFDTLDPAAPIAVGDLVMLRAYSKVRTGVATEVTGGRVQAIVAKPGDEYAGLFAGAAGVDVRKIADSGEITNPAGDTIGYVQRRRNGTWDANQAGHTGRRVNRPTRAEAEAELRAQMADEDARYAAMRARNDPTAGTSTPAPVPAVDVDDVRVGDMVRLDDAPGWVIVTRKTPAAGTLPTMVQVRHGDDDHEWVEDPARVVGHERRPAQDGPDPAAGTRAPAAPPAPAAPAVDPARINVDDRVRVAGQWATVTAKVGDQLRVRFPGARLALVAPGDVRQHEARAVELDMFGGSRTFAGDDRAAIGVAARGTVGRDTGALVQQLGMFDVSDQKQMAGQTALLDALMEMPTAPPPVSVPIAAPDAPDEPTRVPDDLTGWSDEQLSGLFSELSDAPDDQLDEAGMSRIVAEWERREAEMTAIVNAVPDDLGTLDDDQVARAYADVTATVGSLHPDVVARLEAELDRRDAARVAAVHDLQIKRDLLATSPTSMTDQEVEQAAQWAADLGDEQALERVYEEWGRREDAERARLEQAEAERVHSEEASAVAATALIQRVAAERAAENAAAQVAEAEPGFDFLQQLINRVGTGPDVARVIGDADRADDERMATFRERSEKEMPVLVDMFRDQSDAELNSTFVRNWFSGDPRTKEQARLAKTEQQRREAVRLAEQADAAARRDRRRLIHADVAELSDTDLQKFPALLDALPGTAADRLREDRIPQIRAEVAARQARMDTMAAERAAGPAGPVRLENPMEAYGTTERWIAQGSSSRYYRAQLRWAEAKATVYGLPAGASDKDVNAAERTDPRPMPDRAALILAWYRHLAQFDQGAAGDPDEFIRGYDDTPDVADTVTPTRPAKIVKADEVWAALQQQAIADRNAGDESGADRFYRALARTYRIAYDDNLRGVELQKSIAPRTSAALGADTRTPKVRALNFVAEWRRLAAEDGVDLTDTARFGPPDKGHPKATGGRAHWAAADPDQEKTIDALVARGRDWIDAYAEVMGYDVDTLRREEAASAARANSTTRRGASEAAIRQHYDELVLAQWQEAETATRGNLLTKQAQARGVDARRLFSGPAATALANASEELKRWWGENPRLTYAQYKAQLTGGAKQARDKALAGSKGNEFA